MTGKPGELVEGLIVKPGSYGRRTYSNKAKRALVELCKAPGVSVAGLALAHGINANLLRRWIVRYGRESDPDPDHPPERRATLVPVKVVGPHPPATNKPDGSIEIRIGSATIRLKGAVDAQSLAAVLNCLAARA
jgi:transposase